MAKHIKTSELLLKLNNISMECSDIKDEDNELEENEILYTENNDNEIVDHEKVKDSLDSELENICNLRNKRLVLMLSSSEDEKENIQDNKNEITTEFYILNFIIKLNLA